MSAFTFGNTYSFLLLLPIVIYIITLFKETYIRFMGLVLEGQMSGVINVIEQVLRRILGFLLEAVLVKSRSCIRYLELLSQRLSHNVNVRIVCANCGTVAQHVFL